MIRVLYILIVSLLISESNDYADYYFGSWPFNPNKEQIVGSSIIPDCTQDKKEALCECSLNKDCQSGNCFSSPRVGRYCLQGEGTIFPEVILQDQFRDQVNLYDFAGHGKLILIEFSTAWCRPCQELADWFSNDVPTITENRNWKKEYNILKELVSNNEIYFINIMLQDSYKDPASSESLEDWFQMYSDDNIPILADKDGAVWNWVRPSGYPTVILLNDKMEVVQFSTRGWHEAFNYVSQLDWQKESK